MLTYYVVGALPKFLMLLLSMLLAWQACVQAFLQSSALQQPAASSATVVNGAVTAASSKQYV